ncbi:MAG: hypothetical protein ACOCWT_00520 [Desulfohalobiaceae bacterium]
MARVTNSRSEYFRNRHRPGDRVRGTILGYDAPGLAWVEIEGHHLLARIGSGGLAGERRFFRIVTLYPDIVLKDLSGSHKADCDLRHLLGEFRGLRDRFESNPAAPGTTLPSLQGSKASQCRAKPHHPLLKDIRQHLRRMNQCLGREKGRVVHLPWLLPQARQQEGVLTGRAYTNPGAEGFELEYGLYLGPFGAVVLRVYGRRGEWSYRALLQRDRHLDRLRTILDKTLASITGHAASCLGLARLHDPADALVCNRIIHPGQARGVHLDFTI